MATIKEFKEFFLRHTQVNSGSKPDQESGFPLQYYIGSILKYNRFLKTDYPSENIFKKLFESIAFKLNKEDTASLSEQGLTKIASDSNAESRTSNATNDYTALIAPHQLPEIVLTTDDDDAVVGTPSELGGLKLSILRRTLSGLFRKNYKLEVNVDKSIEINSTSKKIQLINDSDPSAGYYYYGTGAGSTKGYFTLLSGISGNLDVVGYLATLITGIATRKFIKQFTTSAPAQALTILHSEFTGVALSVGTMASGTTSNIKIDFQIQVWILDTTWKLLRSDAITPTFDTYSIVVNATTGDITITTGTNQGIYRVILIG